MCWGSQLWLTHSICTYLNNLALNWHVCINVSRHGTCFWPLVHVQRKWEQRIKKGIAKKRLLKEFEDLLVWLFLKMAMHFLCFASCCSSLLYSLSSPWTSRGGSCVFAASLSLPPFSCQSPRSLSLSSQLLSYHYHLRAKPVMYADNILLYRPI